MTTVTARKIRDLLVANPLRGSSAGRERRSTSICADSGVGCSYTGYLVGKPVVGRGMVIFRDPNGHRMITTPVRRVLSDGEGDTLWVETDNSVYRLDFHVVPLAIRAA